MPLSEEEETTRVMKQRVMEILRTAGVVCYDVDDVTTTELDERILGEG